MKNIFKILGALGAGAALMYLYDPNGGRQRRAQIRDRAIGVSNDLPQGIGARGRDLGNRVKGLMHGARSALPATGSNTAAHTDQPI